LCDQNNYEGKDDTGYGELVELYNIFLYSSKWAGSISRIIGYFG
jgi:hypothetical protein